MALDCPYKWRKTPDSGVSMPRPRHGHRAVQIKELIIVFGGGNEGIVDELHVFNTSQNAWFVPQCKGENPPGCAAFGFAVENTRLLVHGGMVEYGKYSGDLYELQATKWEWKKLRPKAPRSGPLPCPRLGHSFTLVSKKIYLFGGLCNSSPDSKAHCARYLNDLYVLDISKNPHQWEIPETSGTPPGPRESHTAVVWKKQEGSPEQKDYLVIYGGMMGSRLGDLWFLDLETLAWQKPVVLGNIPFPRSLHTAVVASNKMYIFGGWMPRDMEKDTVKQEESLTPLQREWKCTNSLGVFDFENTRWEQYVFGENSHVPEPRAGHCAAMVHGRMYLWSGRDGYRKLNESQPLKSNSNVSEIIVYMESSDHGKMWPVSVASVAVFDGNVPAFWRDSVCDDPMTGTRQIERGRAVDCQMALWVPCEQTGWNLRMVCCNDMWFLETQKPNAPGKVQLLRASTNSLDVHWTPAMTADNYTLQIQVYDSPPASASQGPNPTAVGGIVKPSSVSGVGTNALANSIPSTNVPNANKPPTTALAPGKALSSGTQFATLTKPGTTQAIVLTPGSSVPVSGMLKLVPQTSVAQKPAVSKPPVTPNQTAAKATNNSAAVSAVPPMMETNEAIAAAPVIETSGAADGNGSPASAVKEPVLSRPDAVVEKPPQANKDVKLDASTNKEEPVSSGSESVKSPVSAETREKGKEEGQNTKMWYTVGIITETTCPVTFYFVPMNDEENRSDTQTPDSSGSDQSFTPKGMVKHPLLPGTAYKFRVAGNNMCGRGPWSEMSAFKTCLPGFPGAPSNIRITKCPEGALLTWEPPTNHGDNIVEYAVYLATKPHNAKPDLPIPTSQLSFVKVYDDPTPTCVITHENLRYAYYDCSGQKPAIIFRIAAKNEKGYGPATQVRWLQGTTWEEFQRLKENIE